MFSKTFLRAAQVVIGLVLLVLIAGCDALAPQVSYQGKLSDENGNPLNGSYQITFKLYKDLTGGTAIYTETDTVAVTNGLFETVVGPSTVVAGLGPGIQRDPYMWN